MTSSVVAISEAEMKAGMMPSSRAFMGQAEEYSALNPHLFRGFVESGQVEPLSVPAVKFIVDATLGILTQPEVEPRIPKEVAVRHRVASHFGSQVVSIAVKSGMFEHFYEHNPSLSFIASPLLTLLTNPDDTTYIRDLGLAPFYDTSVVSGGALDFLQEQGIAGEDTASIIGRSRGLLVMSGIEKGNSRKAFEYLGEPYADPSHYELVPDREEPAVTFNEETTKFLRSLGGDGCPSGHLPTAHDPNITVLEHSWRRLVNYLVPPDATTKAPKTPVITTAT